MNSEKKKELVVVALSESKSQPNYYALILEDIETQRRIPIIIGAFEAQSIAIAMEKISPLRPLTHDLMQSLIIELGAKITEVLIHKLHDGVFHVTVIIEKSDKGLLNIDARASDAIALAVRFQVPIYAYEGVIEEAGIFSEIFLKNHKKGSLAEYTITELEKLLEQLIAKEDYESAVRIRNLIEKKRNNP